MTSRPFTLASSVALLTIGVVSGIIPSLQGTLLPQLVKEGSLTLAGLGHVAMAEAIGTLMSVSAASAMLKPRRLRFYVLGAGLLALLLDLFTARLTGDSILAARFAHGLCAGILLWVWVGFLTRCDNPGRWVAIYVMVQASILFLLSSWFSTSLLPRGGADAGFAILAGLYALIALLALVAPTHYAPIAHANASIRPGSIGLGGLMVVFTMMSAIFATWVYVKPYGLEIGLDDETTGLAVSTAMAAQIAAGLISMALAGRVRNGGMLLFVIGGNISCLVLMLTTHSPFPFIAGTAGFALFWMLGSPFYMPYLIDIDPTRRSAMHMMTAQLLGVAAGPAIGSMAVHGDTVRNALMAAAILYVLCAFIIVFTVAQTADRQWVRPKSR